MGTNIRGIWVQIFGVYGYKYPGTNIWGINIRGINIRGINIRGTRSRVRGYAYPGYEVMHIRGTRLCISGVRGYVSRLK